MKKLLVICSLIFISCNAKIDESQLHLLNGYWEIKEVTFKDGAKKEYTVNSTVDYIKLDSMTGFRKKVDPKFNGTFETSNDAEPFTIRISNDSVFMSYSNNANSWEEVLTKLSAESFSVKNNQGTTYQYNRFEPINITP
ncbi:lipocalin family protein [Maribacter sp.]|uniref:lipocalin family protein n=1 Tax=Maribacter sp. TaxID=1897614 RepID=UPI0025BCAB30|nr:lipocalin family protein [Maribacter sp.]